MTTPPNKWFFSCYFWSICQVWPQGYSTQLAAETCVKHNPYLDWHKMYSIGQKKMFFERKIGNSPLQMLSVLQHMSNLAGSIQCPTISIGLESPAESQLRGTLQVLLAALGKETHGAGDRNISSYLLKWGLLRPHQLKFGDVLTNHDKPSQCLSNPQRTWPELPSQQSVLLAQKSLFALQKDMG